MVGISASLRFLKEVAKLTAWLDAKRVPVSAPILTRSDRLRAGADGALIELQSVCPGELPDLADPGQVLPAPAGVGPAARDLGWYPDAWTNDGGRRRPGVASQAGQG